MPAHGVLNYFVILRSAEKNANAWIFMRPLPVAVQSLQIEGELAHMFWFKPSHFQFEGNEALQVSMIEEQIQFKILIANLNPNPFSNDSEAVSKLQKEFSEI